MNNEYNVAPFLDGPPAVIAEHTPPASFRIASGKKPANYNGPTEHRSTNERRSDSVEAIKGKASGPVARGQRIEQTLREVSQRLYTSDDVDVAQVLRRFGKAVGAERISLFLGPSDTSASQLSLFGEGPAKAPPVQNRAASHSLPSGSEHSASGHGDSTKVEIKTACSGEGGMPVLEEILASRSAGLVVPVMSPPHRLHGYLDVAYSKDDEFLERNSRSLHVLGHLLASHFERRHHLMKADAEEREQNLRDILAACPEPMLIRDQARVLYVNEAAAELLGAGSHKEVAGRLLYDFIADQHYGLVDAQWYLLERQRHPTEWFEHEVVRLDGRERIVRAYYSPVTYGGGLAAQMVLQDVTAQRRAEERHRRFIETTTEGILCFEVEPPLSPSDEVAARVGWLWEYARLVECNDVAAGLLGGVGAASVTGKRLKEVAPSFASKIVAEFVRSGYHLRSQEFALPQDDGSVRHFVLNAAGTMHRDRLTQVCVSCIEITDRIRLEQRMVEALEKQQNDIGRELHDGTGQLLTSIRMLSENLASGGASGNKALAERAGKIAHLAGEAAEQIRDIYHGLSSTPLQGMSLEAALRNLAASTDALPGLSCSFAAHAAPGGVDPECRLQLYRIAQEAVNNAVRHGRPERIQISLRREEGTSLWLAVEDDGAGFAQEAATSKGDALGLHSMRYRARSIQGTLAVDSAPGEGTTVTCKVPAPGPPAREAAPTR